MDLTCSDIPHSSSSVLLFSLLKKRNKSKSFHGLSSPYAYHFYFKDAVVHQPGACKALFGRGGQSDRRDICEGERWRVCRVPLQAVLQLTLSSTLAHDPTRDLSWERELLNTKWSLVQESERERETQREWGTERETERERGWESISAHRGLIYPLSHLTSVFSSSPLLSLLFSLHRHCCPFSQYIPSFFPLPPSPSLPIFSPSSGWFWTTACHHQQPPPPQVRIHGGKDQQDSGREFVRWSFNESEASSAWKKCMLMICTHQKDPG